MSALIQHVDVLVVGKQKESEVVSNALAKAHFTVLVVAPGARDAPSGTHHEGMA